MANGIIIPDLPQGSGLSASDLLVKDTGNETQKVPVSSAYATENNPGLVSTGSQVLEGSKRFKGGIVSGGTATRFPGVRLQSKDDSTYFAEIFGDRGNNSPDYFDAPNMGFQVFCANNDGTRAGVAENFLLPRTTNGRTTTAQYNILTSKQPVQISEGGTGQSRINTATSGIITATSGSVTSQYIAQWGKVVQLRCTAKPGAATSVGGNAFRGTLAAGYRPINNITNATYVDTVGMVANATSSGDVTIRVISGTLPANSEFSFALIYLLP